MDASKTATAAAPAPATDVVMNDSAQANPSTAAASTDKKEEKKKGRKEKKPSDKPKGKRGAPKIKDKANKPKRERPEETKLLKGISRPATKRLFKQIKGHDKLRLADGATDAIRAVIGVITRGIVHEMVKGVHAAERQTAYLIDAKDAVHKELPRSATFVH